MRYLFLTVGPWEGNASLVRVREFGAEMIRRGVAEVAYVVDDVPYNRKRENLGVHSHAKVLYTTSAANPLKQFFVRRRLIREFNPDFVHVLNPHFKAFPTLALTKWKVVGDWDEWPARRHYYRMHRKLREKFLDRWLRRRSSLIVVASRYMQEQFRQDFGLSAVYIPYATYLRTNDALESPFTEPTAVYMGNIFKEYDHDLIFEAARILKARGSTPQILIMGWGPDEEKWHAFMREHQLKNMQAPGYFVGDELWRRLRHAHVLLFPIRVNIANLSRCPSKTFAYAQARRPVITNRVSEVPIVLGDKAQYIDCTAEAFADAIEAAMKSGPLPDIDYGVEKHNWSARTDDLLSALKAI
jgi:glycosyltransferase involved in cell wall biosynthesis